MSYCSIDKLCIEEYNHTNTIGIVDFKRLELKTMNNHRNIMLTKYILNKRMCCHKMAKY